VSKSYDRCPTCKEFAWLDSHRCPPAHECHLRDYEETVVAHAHTPEEAAAKAVLEWAHNCCEYPDTVVVEVDGMVYKIEREDVVEYHANLAGGTPVAEYDEDNT
jgi:hypothetical protein